MAKLKKVRTIFMEPLSHCNDYFYLDIIASNEMSRQIEVEDEKYSMPLAEEAIGFAISNLPKKENDLTNLHTSRECSDLFYRFGLELGLCKSFGLYPKIKKEQSSKNILLQRMVSGRLTLDGCPLLTMDGYRLLAYRTIIPEILLRQLLEYQFPLRECSYQVKPEGDFNIKPFLEIIRLIVDLDGLSRDELMIYGLQLTNYKNYDAIKAKIDDFRSGCPTDKEQYDTYARECFDKEMLTLYHVDLEEISRKTVGMTFEQVCTSFLPDLRTKMRNSTESFLRLLRYTAKFNSDGRKIWVAPEFSFEVEFLLEHTDRNASDPKKCKIQTEDMNMNLFGFRNEKDFAAKLWWEQCDTKEFLKSIERDFDTSSYEGETKTGSDLVSMRSLLSAPVIQQRIKDEDEKLENSFSMYQSVMDMYDDIRNDRIFDAPLYTVWNAHRTFRMFGFVDWENNFILDNECYPFRAKGPRVSFCEFHSDDFALYIGSLLAEGRIQYEIDGRYYTDVFHSNIAYFETKVAYELFLTRSVSTVTLNHCNDFNVNGGYFIKMEDSLDGKGRENVYRHYLVPVSIDHMMQLLTTAKNAKRKVSPKDVKSFLAACVADMPQCKTVKQWDEVVQEHCNKWLDK